MSDRTNAMSNMPAASFEDLTNVRPKTVEEVRYAVDTAVASAADYAKDVGLCASRSAEKAIGKDAETVKEAEGASLAASVVEKAEQASQASYPGLASVQREMSEPEAQAESGGPEIGG